MKDDNAEKTSLKEAVTGFQTCLASLNDILDEPMKAKLLEIKADVDKVFATLEPAATAEAQSNVSAGLMTMLASAQQVIGSLTEVAKNAKQTALAGLTKEVESNIANRVTAGDLIPKDKHLESVQAAATEARTALLGEITLKDTRKTVLATLGLPLPADTILTAKDEDYNAKLEVAKTRHESLKGYKVAPEKMLALCWDREQSAVDELVAMLKENAATVTPAGTATTVIPAPAANAKDGKVQLNASDKAKAEAEAAGHKGAQGIPIQPGFNPFGGGSITITGVAEKDKKSPQPQVI